MPKKRLIIVMHTPSVNTERMLISMINGAQEVALNEISIVAYSPLKITTIELLSADGIILGSTENFGYMNGALKDFFDRTYNDCLEKMNGRPYALVIRAGNDGCGALRSIETIVTGLGWRKVQEPLICRGAWSESFIKSCHELGMYMTAGLENGIF